MNLHDLTSMVSIVSRLVREDPLARLRKASPWLGVIRIIHPRSHDRGLLKG